MPQPDCKALHNFYIVRLKQQAGKILGSIVCNKTDQCLGHICHSAGLRKLFLRHNFLERVGGVGGEISDKRAVPRKWDRVAAFCIKKFKPSLYYYLVLCRSEVYFGCRHYLYPEYLTFEPVPGKGAYLVAVLG